MWCSLIFIKLSIINHQVNGNIHNTTLGFAWDEVDRSSETSVKIKKILQSPIENIHSKWNNNNNKQEVNYPLKADSLAPFPPSGAVNRLLCSPPRLTAWRANPHDIGIVSDLFRLTGLSKGSIEQGGSGARACSRPTVAMLFCPHSSSQLLTWAQLRVALIQCVSSEEDKGYLYTEHLCLPYASPQSRFSIMPYDQLPKRYFHSCHVYSLWTKSHIQASNLSANGQLCLNWYFDVTVWMHCGR